MVWFFGLFGTKAKYVEEVTPADIPQPKEKKEAFFLQPDDAKTLGDIDFMRQAKVIKRSFPKTLKGEGGKVVRAVSSMSISNGASDNGASSSATFSVESNGTSDRKRSDNSLDAFRQMAKDLKK